MVVMARQACQAVDKFFWAPASHYLDAYGDARDLQLTAGRH